MNTKKANTRRMTELKGRRWRDGDGLCERLMGLLGSIRNRGLSPIVCTIVCLLFAGLSTTGDTPLISVTVNNQYFYTDEFAGAPGAGRATLTDGNGGSDIINATAVSTGSTINLNNGTTGTIAGLSLTINGDVEHAFGGDGNDESRRWRDGEWWLRGADDAVFEIRRKG